MSNERNSHRTAVLLFADRIETRTASNEAPPGATGLAKPRPPLDRAPGQPVLGN
jgi:hypothetical protein